MPILDFLTAHPLRNSDLELGDCASLWVPEVAIAQSADVEVPTAVHPGSTEGGGVPVLPKCLRCSLWLPFPPPPKRMVPSLNSNFGAFCLDVRTLTFCQLMGFLY